MLGQLFKELRRRKVIRSALAYAVIGVGVVEGADVLLSNLNVTGPWVQYLAWATVAGFPVAVILSWYYDVVPTLDTKAERDESSPTSPPGERTAGTSIGVLSFADLSPEGDQEYFCDGVAEEILDALTRVAGLHVAARTSGFAFKGTNKDVREIGKELGVETILEGSVRKAGDRLRVVAQLVSAKDGYHFWSEKYDGEVGDVFEMQERIAAAVVEKMRGGLRYSGPAPHIRVHSENPEAYDLYLKGRYYWARRHKVGLEKALDYFKRSLALDPGYALAHAGIADAFSLLGFYRILPLEEARRLVAQSVQVASSVAPELGIVQRVRGHMQLWWNWDYEGSVETLLRSVELSPGDPEAHLFLAEALVSVGRYEDALKHSHLGFELDPDSAAVVGLATAAAAVNRESELAVEWGERAIGLDPTLVLARFATGMAYLALEDWDPAIEHLAAGTEMSRRNPIVLGLYGETLAMAGRTSEAEQILEEMSALDEKHRPEGLRAILYQILGDPEAANDCMEASIAAREPGLWMVGRNPFGDPLRANPRYPIWMDRIGVPYFKADP